MIYRDSALFLITFFRSYNSIFMYICTNYQMLYAIILYIMYIDLCYIPFTLPRQVVSWTSHTWTSCSSRLCVYFSSLKLLFSYVRKSDFLNYGLSLMINYWVIYEPSFIFCFLMSQIFFFDIQFSCSFFTRTIVIYKNQTPRQRPLSSSYYFSSFSS